MPDLVVLKAGCAVAMHGQKTCFTLADVKDIAEGYNPARYAAPVVVGHPADDASSPAHGWIRALKINGAGALVATVEQVSAELKAAIKAGSYRHLSASLWPPGHPSNPRPGGWSLRHVGALGASPPAIHGLSNLQGLAFSAPTACPTACEGAPATLTPARLAHALRIINVAGRSGISYYAAAMRLAR